MTTDGPKKNLLPLWGLLGVLVLMAAGAATPGGRRLASRFFGSLRVQKVQAVNVDLSNFVGPNANHTLQQMITQMISDKVTTTVKEKGQKDLSAQAASQFAGFPLQTLAKRKDAPKLAVSGQRGFTLTVDRTRLQAILKEAGRSDLVLPQSIDGAAVAVKIPRIVHARYGECPGQPSATANIATPPPHSVQYSDCVLLSEGPSPEVSVPSGLDVKQLAEIGLELAGMSPAQAHEFLQTVNWQATLGVPIPRFMRSYESVKVNGVKGTLLNLSGRRGATYTLVWAKNGMVYSMTGFGDSGDAVSLADSLH